MNTTSRGAVIATAILAGTLGLGSLVVMSGPAVRSRAIGTAPSQTLGKSGPRAVQVRPADMAMPSTPAPLPTASPTAWPSAAPTTQPLAVATPRPTTAPAPRSTPRPAPAITPRPVTVEVTPPPSMLTTQLWIEVYEAPLNENIATIGQAGPVTGNVTTATQVARNYAVSIQHPDGGPGVPFGQGGVQEWYLNIEATWPTGTATMTLNAAITGSYGCPGSMQSMTTVLAPATSASGSFSQQLATLTGSNFGPCSDGSAPTATFTASAALSPG